MTGAAGPPPSPDGAPEAPGRLAGRIAHDVNNLLAVILGYAELMLDSLPAGDPLRVAAEEVRQAALRGSRLTRELLAASLDGTAPPPSAPPPVHRGEEARAARAPEAAPASARTVLLVEDEPGVRALVRGLLERLGYAVITAATAEEAVDLCRLGACPVDLLLTDVVLPGLPGSELAASLRRERPGLRVLLMSGFPDEAFQAGTRPGHEVALLPKPFTPADLARKVREVLDAG